MRSRNADSGRNHLPAGVKEHAVDPGAGAGPDHGIDLVHGGGGPTPDQVLDHDLVPGPGHHPDHGHHRNEQVAGAAAVVENRLTVAGIEVEVEAYLPAHTNPHSHHPHQLQSQMSAGT